MVAGWKCQLGQGGWVAAFLGEKSGEPSNKQVFINHSDWLKVTLTWWNWDKMAAILKLIKTKLSVTISFSCSPDNHLTKSHYGTWTRDDQDSLIWALAFWNIHDIAKILIISKCMTCHHKKIKKKGKKAVVWGLTLGIARKQWVDMWSRCAKYGCVNLCITESSCNVKFHAFWFSLHF